MENKEIISKIIKYLENQPKEIAYRLCANLMLDMHRINIIDVLPQEERDSLKSRIFLNSRSLINFVKKDLVDEELTLGILKE